MSISEISKTITMNLFCCCILMWIIFPYGSAVFVYNRWPAEEKFATKISEMNPKGVRKIVAVVKQVFHINPYCSLRGKTLRENKCQEILNSSDFKADNLNMMYDASRANLAQEKCHKFQPKIISPDAVLKVMDMKTAVSMFQCPYKNIKGSGKGVIFACEGSDSDSLFLLDNSKQFMGVYSTTPVQ